MTPENMLKEGRLDEALQGLTAQVRGNPADAKARVFLFQLLSLLGQWERAQTQLKVSGELDTGNTLMVGAYSRALQGELERHAVMSGTRSPLVIGEPAQWLALLLQSLKLMGEERYAQALPLREQAFEAAEAVSGTIDGERFEWIADADPRFGPCLEVIVNGGYSWVPFGRIRELKFDAPTDLRDKVWAPVQIIWSNGGESVGFVPCRYPGSERAQDSDVVLARKTEWIDLGDDCHVGSGQRMLATDAGEYSLLDVRSITFDA
ncbi:type VI secretion system accessory protein TagJ [Dyella choica]|uniref:Tetratricopeptide repeat protein n=1 Tax=Dyella choica TaxID=1927959 RepID=A0A432M9Q8_9GAMM|nr:type VI secretion system accessory protein TagJ [Dyella choica]RUL77718.1 tetratricopeptide repeat protein [Dyella choica]